MPHSTTTPSSLQSILFTPKDLSPCFFRKPTKRELEFKSYFYTIKTLLTTAERIQMSRYHSVGRIGYDLVSIFGILILKLHYHIRTMKETLLLLQENMNLRDILDISPVPSEASMSRLSRTVENIVSINSMHERLIGVYNILQNPRISRFQNLRCVAP